MYVVYYVTAHESRPVGEFATWQAARDYVMRQRCPQAYRLEWLADYMVLDGDAMMDR